MYRNSYAIDLTHNVGFEFVLLSQGHGKLLIGYFTDNFRVKFSSVFTHIPFWKHILHKRFENYRLKWR